MDPLNIKAESPLKSNMKSSDASVFRDVISSLHKTSISSDAKVREAAIQSLEMIVTHYSLLVMQTWLDQFARTNGGSSSTEYAAPNRVYLLQSLERIVDKVVDGGFLEDCSIANGACIGRIISMACEVMTRHSDVVPDIQRPCSNVLVRIGQKNLNQVMETLLQMFQPNPLPHFYVVHTLSQLSVRNALEMVPFLKGILVTMTLNMKSIKKENLKYAYATALANFSEAILDFLANADNASDLRLTKENFLPEVDIAHDILYSSWISSKDGKVKYSVLGAIGKMAPLITNDRLVKTAQSILNTLISMFKRVQEPFYVTQCIYHIIGQVADKDPGIIEPIIESLLTALFTQMCSHNSISADYSRPLAMKNNHEVLRCYDILVKSHNQKLLQGLIVRMGSVDENIRLAALKALKHILNSSLELFRERMPDVVKTLHSKLALENSYKVKKMLAELIALLGRLGYIEENKEGKEFLDFIVRQCALPNKTEVNDGLKEMCANILQLLASSVPSIEPLLWPRLLDYLLLSGFSNAVTPITKSLVQIILRNKEKGLSVNYEAFQNINGPYSLFSRMIVLAAVPFPEARGSHVLSFIQHFAPNINKHLPSLWQQKIPLLQHYLETHLDTDSKITASLDQQQWDEWLLSFLDNTLEEIDLDEWNTALAKDMLQQLALYTTPGTMSERCFLMKCLGVVLKRCKNRTLIQDILNSLFLEVNHQERDQQLALAMAFGFCGENHLSLTLEKLETLLKSGYQKRQNSLFGFLRDTKSDEVQISLRITIISAVGQIALKAEKADLKLTCDDMIFKFIMPGLKTSNLATKRAALQTVANVAKAVQSTSNLEITLSHHGDLIHEAIECMKNENFELEGKLIALKTTVELIRCPPFISQATRCSLLKACFTAVFPSLVHYCFENEEDFVSLTQTEAKLTSMVDVLVTLVQDLLKQDLEQSTLDEIFTLLEPWLKKEFAKTREMSARILSLSLKTYLENVEFKVGSPTSFAPGPYIIGSIVPRCFDSSRNIQVGGLTCLQTTIQILSVFEGHSQDTIDNLANKLVGLIALSPTHSREPLSILKVSRAISDILCERIQHEQLYPLMSSLIEGLQDTVISGTRGTSLVISKLLERRGKELHVNSADLVSRLYDKLLVIDDMEETRITVLCSIRYLSAHNHKQVIHFLLSSQEVKMDKNCTLASIWKTLTQSNSLGQNVLYHLLQEIQSEVIFKEEVDRVGDKLIRIARHGPLAATLALGHMFDMKEMELACEGEFAGIFVPLLAILVCYAGISTTEVTQKAAITKRPSNASLGESEEGKSPFEVAKSTLIAFLNCKGVSSVAKVAESWTNVHEMEQNMFCLFQSIIIDFVPFLPKLVKEFQPLLSSSHFGRKFSALCFFVQLLQTKSHIDLALKEAAIDQLLKSLENPQELGTTEAEDSAVSSASTSEIFAQQKKEDENALKILTFQGLSCYKPVDELRYDFGPQILVALTDALGEDFKSKVNQASSDSLTKLLRNESVQPDDVNRMLAGLCHKLRPFFDFGSAGECRSAITTLAELSRYATGEYRDVYVDNLHSLMVSLLIHCNDEDEGIQEACHHGMPKMLNFLIKDHDIRFEKDFVYTKFLDQLLKVAEFQPFLPDYALKTLTYFKNPKPQMRKSSVLLISEIVNSVKEEQELDTGSICQALSTMMMSDSDYSVQEVATLHLGKVLVKSNMGFKASDGN